MPKLKAVMFKYLTITLVIVSLVLIPYLHLRNDVQAATFTSISDTMTRQKASTVANHTVAFTQNGSTQFVAGETITVTFESTFDTSGLSNADPLDYDIVIAAQEETIVATGCGATDEIEITSIAADVITFTACASYTAEAAGSTITIEIGTNATAGGTGDTQITNATSSGSKIISLGGTIGDTGQLSVPILAEDQVTVSATVDPTITSTLDTTTCALGTLSSSAVNGCEIVNTVVTNAASGYSSTITENGNLCSPSVAVCTNSIADVADTDIVAGTEEYGVSTTDTDATGITANYDGVACGGATENATAIDGTSKVYADETTPQVSDATTLCYAASITGVTESGSYNHLVTHITTGNF